MFARPDCLGVGLEKIVINTFLAHRLASTYRQIPQICLEQIKLNQTFLSITEYEVYRIIGHFRKKI